MAEYVDKRIKDITSTATEADLTSENYFVLDGVDGTKKFPSNLINAPFLNIVNTSVYSSFDNLPKNKIVLVSTKLSNSPTNDFSGFVQTISLTNTEFKTQIACNLWSGIIYSRSFASSWSSWKTEANANDCFKSGKNISNTSLYASFNSLPVNGTFLISTSLQNTPIDGFTGSVICFGFETFYTQIATYQWTGKTYVRFNNNGSWTAWQGLSTDSELKSFKGVVFDDVKNISWTNGKYIYVGGSVLDNGSFAISSQVEIPKKNKVRIKLKGFSNAVSLISKVVDSSYETLVASYDDVERCYEYINESSESINVVFCSNISCKLKECYLIKTDEVNEDSIFCEFSFFEKFAVIGDSYASGEIYTSGSGVDNYNISWGQILARSCGNTCINMSVGGLSTRTWITNPRGLTMLNSSDAQDLYILALGINDCYGLGIDYLGTEADMDSEADTFYGNYAKIIRAVKSKAPNAKIVISTMANNEGNYASFNTAILKLANKFSIPYIVQKDDDYFSSSIYLSMQSGHPTKMGYSGMAKAMKRLVEKSMSRNKNYYNA